MRLQMLTGGLEPETHSHTDGPDLGSGHALAMRSRPPLWLLVVLAHALRRDQEMRVHGSIPSRSIARSDA